MITFQSSKHPRMLEIQTARAEIADNARFDKAFLIMNALAAIIASYALLADSVSGVIGAMLLSPIAGVSLSLVDGDPVLFRRSLLLRRADDARALDHQSCLTLLRRLPGRNRRGKQYAKFFIGGQEPKI